MEILTPWTGEILALGMLFVLNARVFWTRRTRIDALSLLGPFSVLTIILSAFAWGLRSANIAILALSLVCAVINYRSLVRFSQQLFVDSYSLKFFITSVILLIATIFLLFIEVSGRPVRLQTRRYNVDVQREFFSAPLNNESFKLKKAVAVSDQRNLTLYTFYNSDPSVQQDAVLLFVPDVLAESLSYEPYFILLARRGWTVLTGDMYKREMANSKFFRRFSLIWDAFSLGGSDGIKKQMGLQSRGKSFHDIYESSYKALAKIAADRYPGKKIFVASDSSAFLPEAKLETIFPESRFLNLQSIPEYTTPGYGFAAQTNPIFSWLFLGKKRDKTCFEPSWCATQTIKELERFCFNRHGSGN